MLTSVSFSVGCVDRLPILIRSCGNFSLHDRPLLSGVQLIPIIEGKAPTCSINDNHYMKIGIVLEAVNIGGALQLCKAPMEGQHDYAKSFASAKRLNPRPTRHFGSAQQVPEYSLNEHTKPNTGMPHAFICEPDRALPVGIVDCAASMGCKTVRTRKSPIQARNKTIATPEELSTHTCAFSIRSPRMMRTDSMQTGHAN